MGDKTIGGLTRKKTTRREPCGERAHLGCCAPRPRGALVALPMDQAGLNCRNRNANPRPVGLSCRSTVALPANPRHTTSPEQTKPRPTTRLTGRSTLPFNPATLRNNCLRASTHPRGRRLEHPCGCAEHYWLPARSGSAYSETLAGPMLNWLRRIRCGENGRGPGNSPTFNHSTLTLTFKRVRLKVWGREMPGTPY